jgi:L-lactate dehydrogenase complex protein LldF
MNYAQHEHHDFLGATAQALADPPLQAALVRLTDTLMAANRRGYAAMSDSSDLRDHAKRIKEHTLAHLDQYLEQLEASVVRAGGHVHYASDAAEARQIMTDIAIRSKCKRAVKSKSMTTEEIHLNPALEAAGIEVTETDYGEWIIQIAGERPSHIVAPAVHHTRESIAKVLAQYTGETMSTEPRDLAQVGRRLLRDKFFQADLGISGANFAVAETGTICLITNEGNGRLTTTWPRVHIALMGMEKVIPRMRDLPVYLKLLARAATGMPLSVYTNMVTGPRRAGETDGPEEFHLVVLDNGRSRVLASGFRESLQCIRCGACLNACPVYRRIGGHAYGGIYSGPIGSILTPLYDSVAENPHLPHASSLCGACQSACPIKINIPQMLIGLRELQHKHISSPLEGMAYGVAKFVLARPWLYRTSMTLSRWLLRKRAKDGWIRTMPGPGRPWTDVRDFPAPAAQSFRERWQELNS